MFLQKTQKNFQERILKGEKQYEKDDDSCDDGGVRAGRIGNGIFDIMLTDMDSLCLQMTLLERVTCAGDGMGVGAFCLKEVA